MEQHRRYWSAECGSPPSSVTKTICSDLWTFLRLRNKMGDTLNWLRIWFSFRGYTVHHEVALISTIAVGLVYALIGGVIANRLRLPPLVGYLLAGIVVGPFTPGFVADAKLAPQLAEIGVILLMFGVGLHFSLRDLLAVHRVAVPGALVQVIATVAMSYGVSRLWAWTNGAGLVLGLALSVASTVVLLRALETQGLLSSTSGRIAVGWLVVEDLFTVVVLVLLPALA
ncbi:MAG TPA: cation:proton antiporter, partial [Chthoniobacterales bacterium]|nr:cation:proton antiporter [Chthoniobacterales bacterium]